jgi:very-short-patch-repair endonuclease
LFGRLLDSRTSEAKPADSHLELIVERAIKQAGLPKPVRQHRFVVEGGMFIVVDFYWPEFAVALEVDHDEWHGSRRDRAVDKWRDRQLQRRGVNTVRVTDIDGGERLDQVIDDLRVIIAARFGVLERAHSPAKDTKAES